MSIAQAMLCGLPAVVPDRGAVAELVDPSCGALYRAGDAAACGEAIGAMVRGGAEMAAAGRAARRRAERLPSPEDQMAATLAVHRGLLERRQAEARA
jgi:glycosyltransferase involved in cell wall biosynthesis